MLLNAISQPDNRDWFSLPYDDVDYAYKLKRKLKGLRVAYSATLGYVGVNPEIAALVKQAVSVLEKLGAEVTEIDPGFADPAPIFRTLWWSGARALLGDLSPEKKAMLDPALADVVEQAASITANDIMVANKGRGELGTRMRLFMENHDVLVTPTLPIPAFEAGKLQPDDPDTQGKWVNWTPFTYPFNLTQQPAASVPCGFTQAGLPAGLHVVGQMFDDRTVLRVCAAYEAATQFYRMKPKGY
jgi:aspartyl-tRNA(Asn)/glutamyl-tRNA(Gln) amidotransferase subunit A